MIDNYLFLLRILPDLRTKLVDAKVVSIFTQERRKFLLASIKEGEEFFIEISLAQNFFFITKRDDYNRSGKNSLDFFSEILPLKIEDVRIALFDRAIKFFAGEFSLILTFRGNTSNIFLFRGDEIIDSVMSETDEVIAKTKEEMAAIKFASKVQFEKFFENENLSDAEIKKIFPFMNKQMLIRFHSSLLTLSQFFRQYLVDDLTLIENQQTFEVELLPNFLVAETHLRTKKYADIFEAVNYYIRKRYANLSLIQNRKRIANYFDKELTYLSDKIEKLKTRINKGSKEDEYSAMGNLILIYLHKIKTGDEFAILADPYDNDQPKKIILKKNLTPNQNAEYYFKKARSEKVELKNSADAFETTRSRYTKFLNLKNDFENITQSEELKNFIKGHKNLLKEDSNNSQQTEFRFKEYLIDGKYKVFVGKDSKNNDELTTKFAKQNDLWFHARGVSGSHLIIRVDNSKEPIPKNIIKKAASIAAYHSKAKTSSLAAVAFTFKKYVSKKKGSPAGTVFLQKEEVVLVKPEIPTGVEFISKTENDL